MLILIIKSLYCFNHRIDCRKEMSRKWRILEGTFRWNWEELDNFDWSMSFKNKEADGGQWAAEIFIWNARHRVLVRRGALFEIDTINQYMHYTISCVGFIYPLFFTWSIVELIKLLNFLMLRKQWTDLLKYCAY